MCHYWKKYVDNSVATSHFGEGDEEMVNEIRQQSLLPNIKDPKLWIIKCRVGEEKSIALLLMRKFLTYQSSGKILNLKEKIVIESLCTMTQFLNISLLL